ncbi:MAG: 50S ribosomal protein L30e [Nanoarchaeota archaeon]|nr:50S ribosomal protein L30e [Nanoarchaeota archaeon]MBU4124163.1 50S ribosomal protein L30e [Nanoarchaeota archaeon]
MTEKTLTEKIKDAMSAKKIMLGGKVTIKHLKMKELKSVIISNNCPENMKKDINRYAELVGIEVEVFDGTSKQLGIVCGKPFPIAVLSIK